MKEANRLDILMQRRKAGEYAFRLSYIPTQSGVPVKQEFGSTVWDPGELDDLVEDPARYGRALSQALLAAPGASEFFGEAYEAAKVQGSGLRVRMLFGAEVPELQVLGWETLVSLRDGAVIALKPNVLFSRYVPNDAVRLRSKGILQALVAVLGPSSSVPRPGGWLPLPADLAGELALARACLGEIPITELVASEALDLQALAAGLRQSADILYLACQAVLADDEPWLWVEDTQGAPVLVPASDVVARVRELTKPPRLVVLAPFQNASRAEGKCSSDTGALSMLAPALVDAGIPAVVAMQANVTQKTAQAFLSMLFRELVVDGSADRAAAAGRAAVRDRADWWVPVLFAGHPSGRIWYVPGFAGGHASLRKWPALLSYIKAGRITPILGPYLFETVFGERRAIARRWAEDFDYPLAASDRGNLAKIAQYLAISQDLAFIRDHLKRTLRQILAERYEGIVDPSADFDVLLRTVAEARRTADRTAPDQVLAELPLPIFITSDPSGLLAESLRAAGKQPVVEIARWKTDLVGQPSIYDSEPGYRPTVERPLVYLPFGDLRVEDSVVLLEEDYYEYLQGFTKNRDLVPHVVRRSLSDSSLVFLGFGTDDWEFRILRGSLLSGEGTRLRSRYAHVLQAEPASVGFLDLDRAMGHFEALYGLEDISIYWGSVEDFAGELSTRWESLQPSA